MERGKGKGSERLSSREGPAVRGARARRRGGARPAMACEQSSAQGESESGEGKSELALQIDKDGTNTMEGRRRERPRAAGAWSRRHGRAAWAPGAMNREGKMVQ